MKGSIEQPLGAARSFPVLSDLVGRIEVRCDICSRHGRYRADKLLAEIGDVSIPQAMAEIAKRGGCERALKPPDIGDIHYNEHVCKIRRLYTK